MVTCGVDEAGRGPLAGPVTAGAVVLNRSFPIDLLADSKALSQKRRDQAAVLIRNCATAWAIGWATHREIDQLNIHNATLLAMQRAVRLLTITPDEVVVDGKYTPELPYPAHAIIHGDSIEPSIMAASILAKTCRDRWMTAYASLVPEYGFDKHKGYPTKYHREMIRALGISDIHRVTFRLVYVPSPPAASQ